MGDRPRSGQGMTLPPLATSRIFCDGAWRNFPESFPGFSLLETQSLAAYGQLFNHSNKFKEAKTSYLPPLVTVDSFFLENNLKSKEPDGHSRGCNPPPPFWVGGMTDWSPTVLDGCLITFIPRKQIK